VPPDAMLTTPARNVKLNGAGQHQRDAVREQLERARHCRRNFLRPVPVRRPAGDELSAPLLPHPLAMIFGADWQGGGPDSVGIQRQGAKPPRRNRILLITKPGNQESSKRFHGVLASLWNCFWSRLCALAFGNGGRFFILQR